MSDLVSKVSPDEMAVGIDIESCQTLPASADPWSDSFYRENFTAAEIAYCVRQADPRLAFCGLWSAKEAAFKCGGKIAKLAPREIEIVHEPGGQPRLRLPNESAQAAFGDYQVSISHSTGMAIAVCVKRSQTILVPP